jgi:hypothetical protein
MDRRQVKRSGKAAGGGGVGNVGELAGLAFFCHLCKISFSNINDHGFHMLTEHASETDLADDDTRTGAPPSFVENPVFGPKQSDFTPHHAAKIQEMLNKRIGGPDTVKMPVIPPPLVPRSQDLFGCFRGIQGRMNSCYLDVFFMLFAFSPAFDGIFTQEALNGSIFLRIVLFEIVIPLRTMMYVKRDVVAMLRTFLADATRNREYLTNTWDFTEFLMDLMKQVDFSNVCNFIGDSIACNFLIQLEGIQHRVLNLQQLVDHTMKINEITSPVPPEAIILRVRPNRISEPPLCLPQSTVSLNGCSYRLSAIICMSRFHYTGFYRLENGMWVFFDCMRDKENGHSIPFITRVRGFSDYLANGCDERFLSEKNDGGSRDLYDDRVREGSFAYIYSMNDDRSQPFVQTVPVLPPRIQALIVDETKVLPPPQSNSAGGGAAAVPHQSSSSFGHAQLTCCQVRYDGSKISNLTSNGAFYDAIIALILASKPGPYPDSFLVNKLTLVLNDLQTACNGGVWVSGSFGFFNGTNKHLFRAVSFQFDDNTDVNHTGTVASLKDDKIKTKFVDRVNEKWRSSMITSITFAKCN